MSASSVGSLFATEVIGGVALGAVIGFLGLKLVKYIENEHVELEVLITLSLVLLVSIVSHQFHFSGVLGVVVMGLFLNRNIIWIIYTPTSLLTARKGPLLMQRIGPTKKELMVLSTKLESKRQNLQPLFMKKLTRIWSMER